MFKWVKKISPISWFKKKILKSIINDIKKELPTAKSALIDFVVEKKGKCKDELLDFCKKKLKEALEEYIENNLDKED